MKEEKKFFKFLNNEQMNAIYTKEKAGWNDPVSRFISFL